MANWTLAPALAQLRAEVNDVWPGRSKASDGTLGDPAHASRTSDHNPNSRGVVRALDITAAGIAGPAYAEHIRALGAAGHPALQNHGYVIWNRRAAYATSGWRWQRYTGSNPHDKHCHVSVGRDPAQYDSTSPWRIAELVEPNTEDDDMTQADVDAIKKEQTRQGELLGEVYQQVVGSDLPGLGAKNPRHNSIATRLRYLFGESIGDPKALADFRALFDNAISDSATLDDLAVAVAKIEADIVALAPPPT